MFDEKKLIAFVDGFVTDEPDLTDQMYADAFLHNENGRWQMIWDSSSEEGDLQQGLSKDYLWIRRSVQAF
jgi:hypothetical protein